MYTDTLRQDNQTNQQQSIEKICNGVQATNNQPAISTIDDSHQAKYPVTQNTSVQPPLTHQPKRYPINESSNEAHNAVQTTVNQRAVSPLVHAKIHKSKSVDCEIIKCLERRIEYPRYDARPALPIFEDHNRYE